VFVVEFDGEHVTPGLLRSNAQTESDIIALHQFTHGSLIHPHALRRQRTCVTAIRKCKLLQCILRPLGTIVPRKPYVLLLLIIIIFIFLSTRHLQVPSADRREILPHGRRHVQFYNPGKKN